MHSGSCSFLAWIGLVSWSIFALVIVALSIITGAERSLIPLYIVAASDFWAGKIPAADYLFGYYYLPASQILFSPFAWAGLQVGGIVWRLLAFALLTLAVWEWAKILVPSRKCDAGALMLVLLIPGAAGALRVGQFEAPMWALVFLGYAAIARGYWWAAASALALAFALKPTAVVPMLLAGVLWPALGLRLLPLVLAALTLPFLFAHGEFVSRLYMSLFDGINGATHQTGPKFKGLFNMLEFFGLAVPYAAMTWVRVIAALATLALGWMTVRRLPQGTAAFMVLALAAIYLLVFNPRVEGLDYIALSLVAAPLAARSMVPETRPSPAAAVLILVCISVGMPGLTSFTVNILGPWLLPSVAILTLFSIVLPRLRDPQSRGGLRSGLPDAEKSLG
jgi:hypothetical protein